MPNPVPIALVVCDNVYADSTGKRALVGLFNQLVAHNEEGPILQPRLCVYISMTDVYPGTSFQVDIVHAETDEPVMAAESPPAPSEIEPTMIFDFQFELNNIQFPEPGTYYVRFLSNNETLLQRPIRVVRTTKGKTDAEFDAEEK
ncbi:MAG: hypothetical protein KY476_06115 [Planctomycetes bacterium]|nr:hypothetical protein [Planctomycetota bacterium]